MTHRYEQERTHLRILFNQDALLYDQARPGYPEELFDDIVLLSDIPTRGRILEIGSGTGQATVPLAHRGYHILGIELGENMAAVARHHLSAYPQAQIVTQAFEEWPVEQTAFDLVFSATAFHWIDPALAYPKIAQALKPSGTLALVWHVHVQSEASQGFFEAVQKIYQREVPSWEKNYRPLPWPDEVAEPVKAQIERTSLFGPVTVRRHLWEITYDATSYIRLLHTYSDHRVLEDSTRERLYRDIADLIETQFNGHVTKGYMALLYLARAIGRLNTVL